MTPKPASPIKFSLANIITLSLSLISVGVTFGITAQRLSQVENRIELLESGTNKSLQRVEEQIIQLRVDTGKMAKDVEWLRTTANPDE
jgi:hypothetical protein